MATVDIESFTTQARQWLSERLPRRDTGDVASFDVSVFHDLTGAEERSLIDDARAWQRTKFDAGFGALCWPAQYGGADLDRCYQQAFDAAESQFDVPPMHELLAITLHLMAPTLARFGTPEQQETFVRSFLRGDRTCCQLFTEPGAGSDLASLATRAVAVGNHWIVDGQKVWSSAAQFADFGLLIARTDPDVPKHAGLTAFVIPMDLPGIEIRPLRQMSGGSSFNEVFLDSVRVADGARLGAVGEGWTVTIATLGFERQVSGSTGRIGGGWQEVKDLARRSGALDDPLVRQRLADVYLRERIVELTGARHGSGAQAADAAVGSLRKLHWVRHLRAVSAAATGLLGTRLVADTGEAATFAWGKHVLGAPGYRIAGGSDEIQRNIIAERILGLPPEPRVDRDIPWREIPR